MSGSIRDLATYLPTDAFRPHADAIAPEQTVLERYTFIPFVRTGVAAALSRPFDWNAPKRADAKLSVPVVADAATKPAEVDVVVRGPGDVTAFDARQVIRCYPKPNTPDALTEELAHVEFDRPDFPWLFTPTGPTADARLVPWVTLVVVPRQPGGPEPLQPPIHGGPPILHTTRAQLPPLSDAWAWAHAQVMGGKNEGSIPARLSSANPTINLSRLLCPRHLEPLTAFVACVVPTFRAGREAGLGQPVTTTTLAPSWNDDDDPATEITLPVYFSFTFSTGEALDFKALAERLDPLPAPPGIGRRRMDTTHPAAGIPDVATGPGQEMVVEGPIVSLQPPGPGWPSEADQQWPAQQLKALRDRLNAQEAQKLSPSPDQHPTVGPPLYAGAHVRRTRVNDASPGWFRELNTDPRNRVVAGVGARVVQHDQEALMAEAWNQVAGVEAANAALRFAQLGRYVSASIHRRHVEPVAPAALLALTNGVHGRILDVPGRTVHARVAASSLPPAITSGAFRRLVRARGPVARFAAADIAARPAAIAKLTADDGALTRNYVRSYRNPDGIDALSPLARSLIKPELAAHAWPGTHDPIATLTERAQGLATGSVTDALVGAPLVHLDPHAVLNPPTAPSAVLEQLLLALPAKEQIQTDRAAAAAALTLSSQLLGVMDSSNNWTVPTYVAQSVGFEVSNVRDDDAAELGFAHWTNVANNVATGTVAGRGVTLTGGIVSDPPSSTLDGSAEVFATDAFSPPLPKSDALQVVASAAGHDYELRFDAPVSDPVLYIGSLASTLEFAPGTQIAKLSGQETFTLSDNSVIGAFADETGGTTDANGTVRLLGIFDSVSFVARSPGFDDGIYLQLAAPIPSTVTTVNRGQLEPLIVRVRELAAHHELPQAFQDPASRERLGSLLISWQQPPAGALVSDLTRLGKRLVSPGGATDVDRDRIHIPDLGLVGKLDPRLTVVRRVTARLRTRPTWLRPDWFNDRRVEPVLAAPRFDHPMYEALDRYDRSWLIPGIGLIEQPDMVTLLSTNGRFVEAFLVGLNHEFARELLWREYPTDGRATCFRSFWTRNAELLQDVHAFDDARPLGGHMTPTLEGRVVLLVRGELIRRFPGLVAHAVEQHHLDPQGRPAFVGKPVTTLFQINLAPNLLLAGFDLSGPDVLAADPDPDAPLPATGVWWFTLAENPTEPRFGLDDGPADHAHLRDDMTWSDLTSGQFLRPGSPALAVKDTPGATPITWGAEAASVAHILYQPPSRAAFRGAWMVKKGSA